MSTIYLGDHLTALLDEDGILTLRTNEGIEVTNTVVMTGDKWTLLLDWIEDIRKDRDADAHRLLGPYSVL